MSLQVRAPTTALAHVLAVDDDPIIRDAIADYLGQYEFRVTAVADGGAMQAVLANEVVDLVVLDLKLLAEDGMALARRLRDESAIPIVMLTGRREEADRVMGLELGADDYLTKPFSPRELLARIRAVLRRRRPEVQQGRPEGIRAYRFDGWELNLNTRRLRNRDGQAVLAPVSISSALQAEVHAIARKAIDALKGIGIFGIEFFLDKDAKLWLNEIAPRSHNLGHYTIEACTTSQFTQHLRAITNLPLTSTAMRYPAAAMINILGTRNGPATPEWASDYDHQHVFVHLYGKAETKIDRKMGHITVVGEDLASVYQQAKETRAALSI